MVIFIPWYEPLTKTPEEHIQEKQTNMHRFLVLLEAFLSIDAFTTSSRMRHKIASLDGKNSKREAVLAMWEH